MRYARALHDDAVAFVLPPAGEPMLTADVFAPPGENRILAILADDDRQGFRAQLERVQLEFKHVIYEPNEPVSHVYFPLTGMISLLTIMDDGSAIEVATVGNEGMIGLPVFLGAGSMPGRAITQVPSEAWRMPAEAFRAVVHSSGALHQILQRYTQALLNQIAQSAACNRVHPMTERCARWILLTHDRIGVDAFPLTHEFLSQMLGVRRATVTVATGALHQARLIRSHRGRITVLDRAGLESASCECYRVIRDEYDRLLGAGA